MSFVSMIKKQQGNLVYLVRGTDQGKKAWHYVLVKKFLLKIFLKKIDGGSLDVADYGEVLSSGWGENPPQSVIDQIERQYYE